MHISALQLPHSSHQDFEISPLLPYLWKRTNKPSEEKCLGWVRAEVCQAVSSKSLVEVPLEPRAV